MIIPQSPYFWDFPLWKTTFKKQHYKSRIKTCAIFTGLLFSVYDIKIRSIFTTEIAFKNVIIPKSKRAKRALFLLAPGSYYQFESYLLCVILLYCLGNSRTFTSTLDTSLTPTTTPHPHPHQLCRSSRWYRK